MRKISVLMFTCAMSFSLLHAQTNTFPATGAAGIGTLAPNASSLLEITSTTKGILIPRMNKAQRDLIASPVTGLLIYQTNSTPGFYYYNGTGWAAVTPKAKGWLLTGNTGTDPATNFIGTSDAQPLLFKVNNQKAGYLDHLNGSTGFGYQTLNNNVGANNTATEALALYSNTTGIYNTAHGHDALYSNTFGGYNTANGSEALYSNTTASYNTATGTQSLYFNSTGTSNTANGSLTLFSNTIGENNTAIGTTALYANTTGFYNTATGSNALSHNTTGGYNTANGFEALYANTQANFNSAFGYGALHNNTNGLNNTATGVSALYNNTTGNYNTANGYSSLLVNTTGSSNTANGMFALSSNASGNSNTGNGYYALYANTAGYSNVAIGVAALYSNTTGRNLVAVGDSALYHQSTNGNGYYFNTAIGSKALYNNTSGYDNTAVGYQTLFSNTSGYSNGANGLWALYSNTTGFFNTANGVNALQFNTSGFHNTANGAYALNSNNTGVENTALGYNADVAAANLSNATAIGANAIVDATNKVRVGDNSVTSIGGKVGWTTFPSDGRYKKNIKEDVKGLAFINSLKPITYTIDIDGLNTYFDKNKKHDEAYEKIKKDRQPSADEAATIVYNGFIAQDVEAAAKKLNYNFSGVDKPKTDDGLYGLRYSDFVVPLVKAVQELSNMNNVKDAAIDTLKKENADLKKQFADLKTLVLSIQQCSPCNTSGAIAQTYNTIITDGAALEQNVPNPFSHATAINYTLPQKFTTAQIMITDKNGKTLKLVNVSGTGKGKVNVDASTLASGAYNYSLLVDGKVIGTKQMILSK